MEDKIKTKTIKLGLLSIVIFLVTGVFLFGQLFLLQVNASSNPETEEAIEELNDEIAEKKQKIDELKKQKDIYEKNLEIKRQEASSLSNQVYILNAQINKTETEIAVKEAEIEKTKLEIKNIELHILDKEEKIEEQKSRLSAFIRQIDKADQRNYLEVLILNDSFSEFYNQLKYIEDIQYDLQIALDKVKLLKQELEDKKIELENKNDEQELIKETLEEEYAKLENERGAKQILLTQTKNSESKFKSLLSQLKQEQSAIDSEIAGLESKIREELKKLETQDSLHAVTTGQLIWPVPSRQVTAYFHDPDYPFRYIFEHPAIDIRASQSTPIKAAEGGYVAQAKDNGFGYSYIMLIHENGLSTVYGHVSRIDVKADTYVYRGQVIGLSGGMPGTLGAGRLSTGPHLHFEVRHNGIPVNPLEYLP